MALRDKFASLAALKPGKNRGTISGGALDDGISETGLRSRGFSPALRAGAERLAAMLEGKAVRNSYGEHLAVRKWFSEPIGFPAPDGELNESALRLLAPGFESLVSDPRQWLLLDTETTGLMGGTGTYPFLVGIAWWDAGGLEVEQFFMREHSEEHALLVTLAERMAERRVLVTFNGKSFDWPLLETRFRMTRKIAPPVPRAHLDFLHPSRNLWRLRLGSVRLAELEKHVLGFHRGADLISAMIPQFYFDYLRGGAVEPVVEIFKHNQTDLRGLAGLASKILSLLAEPEKHSGDPLELFGVSRICERRGETVRARKHYAQSIERELPAEADRFARRALARMARRAGDVERARELWESMVGNSREGFEAYEQLAIYHERVTGQLREAAALVKRALAELRRSKGAGLLSAAMHRQYKERFEHRLLRLVKKSAKTLLDGIETRS